MFKYLLSGVAGAALGGVAGYLYAKKKLAIDAQKEIDEFKKEYKNRMSCPDKIEAPTSNWEVGTGYSEGDIVVHNGNHYNCDMAEEDKKIYKTADKPVLRAEIMDARKKQEDIVNYSGYSANKEDEMPDSNIKLTKKAKESIKNRKAEKYKDYKNYDGEDDDFDEEEDEEDEGFVDAFPTEGPSDHPYSITPEQFASENPYFDKVTLMYYAGDDTLADEDENIINDEIANCLGIGFRNWFGEYETNVAYVRNEKMSSDYEVLYLPGKYTES